MSIGGWSFAAVYDRLTAQVRALEEIRRVLVPGGRLLFIEHVRSDEARLAKWQDRLNGLNRIVARGCNGNRATARRHTGQRIHNRRAEADRITKSAAVRPPAARRHSSSRLINPRS